MARNRNIISETAEQVWGKLKKLTSHEVQLPEKEINIIRLAAQEDIAGLIALCESEESFSNKQQILRQLALFSQELQNPQILTATATKRRYGKGSFVFGLMQDISNISRETFLDYAGKTEAVIPGGIIFQGQQKKGETGLIESHIRRIWTTSQDYANEKMISMGFLILPADSMRQTLEDTFDNAFELNMNNTIRIKYSSPEQNYPEEIYTRLAHTDSGEIIYVFYRESNHELPGSSPQASAEESFMPGLSPAPNPSS